MKHYNRVISEVEDYEIQDDLLKRMAISILSGDKLFYDTELSSDQVIQLSKRNVERNKMWKTIAINEYNISVSEREIDEMIIENGIYAKHLPEHTALADALGITNEELFYEYFNYLNERFIIWTKLKPKLEEKYNIRGNNNLLEKYNEEIDKQLNR